MEARYFSLAVKVGCVSSYFTEANAKVFRVLPFDMKKKAEAIMDIMEANPP